MVSAAASHTCALKTDGTVVCWAETVPSDLTAVAQVSSGYGHTLALRIDGTVVS